MSTTAKNGKHKTPSLQVEVIVLEEFKHASAYSLQMLSDRASAKNMYVFFWTAIAAVLGLFIKPFDQPTQFLTEQLTLLAPYAPLLLLIFGLVHIFFFTRLGHLEKKYNEYTLKMNDVRNFYLQHLGSQFPSLQKVIAPKQKPMRLFYPLFPTTPAFALVAVVCFATIPYSVSWKWSIPVIFSSVFIALYFTWVFYRIGSSQSTI